MTTAINEALAHVSRLWRGVVPQTRPASSYHRLDGDGDELEAARRADDGADRGFFFEQGISTSIQETGSGYEMLETSCVVRVLFSLERIGHGDIRAVMTDEMQRLRRVIDLETSWPVGVLEVVTDEPGPEDLDETSNLAAGAITLLLTTQET